MTGSDKEENQSRTSTATLLLNLAGSVCFCAGSIGFIWSTWTNGVDDDWLRPFQYGCTIWILGCILFLLPLLLAPLITTLCCHCSAHSTTSTSTSKSFCCWSRSEMCLCGCLVCFLVGCAFATTYSTEETVLRFLPPMNALFLAGSALLFVDSLVVAFAFGGSHHRTRTRTGSSFHKLVVRMCCQGDDDDNNNDDDDDSAHGSITGLVVGGSYVFAGILGGMDNRRLSYEQERLVGYLGRFLACSKRFLNSTNAVGIVAEAAATEPIQNQKSAL
jgi:hypothetical protein